MGEPQLWRPRVLPAAVLRHDRVRGADVLLLPERVVVLHGSGRAVLELCDGSRTVDEIAARLSAGADTDIGAGAGGESRVRHEVTSFLHRLRTEGCLR
ncbi:pyrroloquinoline quinone biosynthesis peptide chaperone PqqD [Streptomyces phaeolivaceus]|uniref:Pyrroloquinoline quinone biosynthesis peptide chaperone PqqD n=1 Tax=Streptomyces phaeolivaceus TaxID=2653200 RepID=A0A5P8KGC6_9ACTN|nr:pyrroloquinoline quinone biosynthesis peptide chaperone PqqD [Streptomyces phaeolivaceus]QFR01590.1 pyrroloquinoline quinone biosynthesis peptide chaperone PqqD [Streptomyces phaeolivaceus]